MRKGLLSLLTGFFSLGVALLLGEMIIRMLYGSSMNMFPRYHSSVQYGPVSSRRIRPNTTFRHSSQDGDFYFETNNRGFRDHRPVDYPKPAGECRILVLGDSHTQGYEVQQYEPYSAILEYTLGRQGKSARVLNAGVSGFSTAEALNMLRYEGLRYHPDAVVLGFFANDFSDNIKDGLYRLEGDSLVMASNSFQPGVGLQDRLYQFGLIRWLSEYSYLYSFAFNTAWDLSKQWLIRTRKEKQVEAGNTGKEPNTNQNQKEYAIGTREADEYEVRLALALLNRIHSLCREQGIPFVVVDIPQLPFRSSIPKGYESQFAEVCDTLLMARSMVSSYRKMGQTHVPHGHNHISAESHRLIGVRLAGIVQHRTLCSY